MAALAAVSRSRASARWSRMRRRPFRELRHMRPSNSASAQSTQTSLVRVGGSNSGPVTAWTKSSAGHPGTRGLCGMLSWHAAARHQAATVSLELRTHRGTLLWDVREKAREALTGAGCADFPRREFGGTCALCSGGCRVARVRSQELAVTLRLFRFAFPLHMRA